MYRKFWYGLKISVGERISRITMHGGYRFAIGIQNAAWFPMISGSHYPKPLTALIDLSIRSDNGRINSSPKSTMAPFVTVISNARQIINIHSSDVDSDFVKCRWASRQLSSTHTSSMNHQGVCENIQVLNSSHHPIEIIIVHWCSMHLCQDTMSSPYKLKILCLQHQMVYLWAQFHYSFTTCNQDNIDPPTIGYLQKRSSSDNWNQ